MFFSCARSLFPSPFKHRFCQGSAPCARRCWPQRPISVQWLAWRCIFMSWAMHFLHWSCWQGVVRDLKEWHNWAKNIGDKCLGFIWGICVLSIFQLSNWNYMFLIFAWPQAWRNDLSREDHRWSPSRKGWLQTRFRGIGAKSWDMYICLKQILTTMFGCQTAFDLLETAEAAAKNHANRGVLRSNSSHSIHFRSTIINMFPTHQVWKGRRKDPQRLCPRKGQKVLRWKRLDNKFKP